MAEEDKGLWETIKPDMVKLLTVGVLGSILSGAFGFATWVRDKRLARLEENIKNAEQIHSDAIALAHERWYRGFRLLDELSLKVATRIYDDVLTRWNVVDAPLLSRIDMAVDSALGNSVPVSLRDISKIDCHNAFFRNSHGDEVPELDRLSVKTWHIAMSHCFIQLNDAIQTVRNHMGENGKPDDLKNFLDDLKNAGNLRGRLCKRLALSNNLPTAADGAGDQRSRLLRGGEQARSLFQPQEKCGQKSYSGQLNIPSRVGNPGLSSPWPEEFKWSYFPFRKRAHLIRTLVTPALVCRSITAMVRPCQHSTKAAISAST